MSAWTQDHLDRLERAIASGQESVRFEDRGVTYRGLDEMLRIRDLIRRERGVTGAQPRERRRYARYSKDL